MKNGQNLAIKYRPKDWNEVVGHNVQVQMLKNICNQDPIKIKNFLLIGPAGLGKTTLAYLIAKNINGGVENYVEIDAASHNGVDFSRDLIDSAYNNPLIGKYNVFIIDECHSLTKQSWQTFLKPLEDPSCPSIFIFCTTNPENIPDTIFTRVCLFKFDRLSDVLIENRLREVIKLENDNNGNNINYEDNAIKLISKKANGSLRDALTSLDTVLLYDNNVTTENVQKILDLPDYDDYFNLLNAILRNDEEKIINIIHTKHIEGENLNDWIEQFHSFTVQVVEYLILKDMTILDVPITYKDKMDMYKPAHLQVCLKLSDILLQLINQLRTAQFKEELIISSLITVNI